MINFNFPRLTLPAFSAPQPLEILKIVEHYRILPIFPEALLLTHLSQIDLPQLRSMDEIVEAIEGDSFDTIHLLEWIYCIYFKAEWDRVNHDRAFSTSRQIWSAAIKINQLKAFLLWDLALTYGSKNNKQLADSLVKSFNAFQSSNIVDREIVDLIQILKGKSPDLQIAKLCQSKLVTPHTLFNSYRLPTNRIDSVLSALDCIPDLFIQVKQPKDSEVKWLLTCLESMTVDREITAVDRLLTRISSEIGIDSPDLVRWISDRYTPGSDKERWNRLSQPAKAALQKWKGAVNYGDFQRLVNIVMGGLSNDDINYKRLNARRTFWEHYTDRFDRIRILVPQSSHSKVRDIFSDRDISVLKEDRMETEICIFDFQKWFVVEFFRGKYSEIRIFPKDPQFEQILFSSNDLSVSKIRSLGGDIHDHVFCWQNSCVKWLMKKQIYPNDGTKYFRGIPREGSAYNRETGLPPLSLKNSRDREYQLRGWQQNMDALTHLEPNDWLSTSDIWTVSLK